MPDRGLADELWTMGAAHVQGALALAEVGRKEAEAKGAADPELMAFNGRYSASMHLLVGYALELLLKAAYIGSGGDESRLQGKRGIHHDLVKALDFAEAEGFVSAVPGLRFLVENVRQPHAEHHFRYGGTGDLVIPDLPTTLPRIEALAREVGRLVLSGTE